MCGGTPRGGTVPSPARGLSPRVRGNRVPSPVQWKRTGSIPACAGEPRLALPPARARRVYPRVCGGTTPSRSPSPDSTGLSPRVRGNQLLHHHRALSGGSIPACAGEPQVVHLEGDHPRVYPRVCGGTVVGEPVELGVLGLSPRVRGNRFAARLAERVDGSIPACAGEPLATCVVTTLGGVYPRVCGGTKPLAPTTEQSEGLSPRVRGNLLGFGLKDAAAGSIPACAGEPLRRAAKGQGCRVYPRVCGGTEPSLTITVQVTGLSPRVRGNHAERVEALDCAGSIPACAGDRDPCAPWSVRRWSIPACAGEPTDAQACSRVARVYPRVCGGTEQPSASAARRLGSIPACAGEPLVGRLTRPTPRVYPRVCGGTSQLGRRIVRLRGLSPRVRGNHAASLATPALGGSIPACAGEPTRHAA